MLIVGAKGHAKEITGILATLYQTDNLFFFDDLSTGPGDSFFRSFEIVKTSDHAKKLFETDPRFILGIGKPSLRKKLSGRFSSLGGELTSIISPDATIGGSVRLHTGLNIMTGAVITEDVEIGEGTLIHIHSSIHHDVRIGSYCELSPGCRILGNVTIGSLVSIGSNAVILPGIKIGDEAVIGAGAVVTKNVEPGLVVKGIPAR